MAPRPNGHATEKQSVPTALSLTAANVCEKRKMTANVTVTEILTVTALNKRRSAPPSHHSEQHTFALEHIKVNPHNMALLFCFIAQNGSYVGPSVLE